MGTTTETKLNYTETWTDGKAWTDGKGDTLIITTRGETTSVRISPANNLKSKEIWIPLETLKEMVNAQ